MDSEDKAIFIAKTNEVEMKFDNHYDAYWYIVGYDKDKWFNNNIDISVMKVNPITGRVDDDMKLNTEIEIWLECGEIDYTSDPVEHYHDVRLDCGAPTYEEAIVKLANLIYKYYDKK